MPSFQIRYTDDSLSNALYAETADEIAEVANSAWRTISVLRSGETPVVVLSNPRHAISTFEFVADGVVESFVCPTVKLAIRRATRFGVAGTLRQTITTQGPVREWTIAA